MNLADLAVSAGPYPDIGSPERACCMFAAGFLGANEAIHPGHVPYVKCVDIDRVRLAEMERIYPVGWEFVCADAYTELDAMSAMGEHFDLISLDPQMNQRARCLALLPRLRELADTVVLGVTVPDCGADEYVERCDDSWWAVWR